MEVREFLYLDTQKLDDYAAIIDPAQLQGYREAHSFGNEKDVEGGIRAHFLNAGAKHHSGEETQLELSGTYTARNLFSRIYDRLGENVHTFDESSHVDIKGLKKGTIVEVSREFLPSPIHEMITAMLDFLDMIGSLEAAGMKIPNWNQDAQTAANLIAMIFEADDASTSIPMVAEGQAVSETSESEPTIMYISDARHLLIDPEEFSGDMTVFGRVQRVVPGGKSIDLIDQLKLFSRGMRRTRQLREAMLKLFESWPEELGGPFDRDSVILSGPVILVSPLAVYE